MIIENPQRDDDELVAISFSSAEELERGKTTATYRLSTRSRQLTVVSSCSKWHSARRLRRDSAAVSDQSVNDNY